MPKTTNHLDRPFNANDFAGLVVSARGTRSNAAYARECGVNALQLGRYILCQRDTPPSVPFIKKIAAFAENNVSYADLLYAAGYDPTKYDAKPKYDNTDIRFSSDPRAYSIRKWILQALASFNYRYTVDNSDIPATDVRIYIAADQGLEYNEWRFVYIPNENEAYFAGACSLLNCIEKNTMLSFVTTSESFFGDHSNIIFDADNAVSIIFIDPLGQVVKSQRSISNISPNQQLLELS